MSVRLFQRRDLLQVFSDGDVQCRLLDSFAGCFKPGDTQFAAFQFMALAPLYLKCLRGGDASAHSTASAAHVPLDIVAAAFRFSCVRFRASFNNRVLLFLSAFRYSSLTRSRYCSRECMSILGAFTALHPTRALGHILK